MLRIRTRWVLVVLLGFALLGCDDPIEDAQGDLVMDVVAGDSASGDVLGGPDTAGDGQLAQDSVDTTSSPDTASTDTTGDSQDTVAPFVCDLGTVYPGGSVIDADAPVFEDQWHTQGDVTALFADAKAADDDAYRAYKAARTYSHLMTCPFCPCGCDRSAGHKSAIDCFTDMHGFT